MDPGVPLAALIKESIIHWSTQHMKALGHMVSWKKIFLCFSHDAPGAGPVWTPGARLVGFIAEFIKRTTIHCYTHCQESFGDNSVKFYDNIFNILNNFMLKNRVS